MATSWSATCVSSLLALGIVLCSFHHAGAAEDEALAVQKITTQQIVGAYPRDLRALPDGGIAFVTYGLDGNGQLQHILGASEYHDTPLVQFGSNTTPIAWDDKYVVARSGNFYVVADRQRGTRVNRRAFTEFSAAHPVIQLEGGELVVAPFKVGIGTAFRRISVPDLKVTERIGVPFTGTFLRYGNKLVGLGYLVESSYRAVPSVVVLDEKLQIEKSGAIDASKLRNNSACEFSAPTIQSHYLVYGADCGGVHVFDLNVMQEVSRRERVGKSNFYTFALGSNLIAAVDMGSTDGSLEGFLFEFPSLRPLRSFLLEGTQVLASADRLYVLAEPDYQPRQPYVFDVKSYRIAAPIADHD